MPEVVYHAGWRSINVYIMAVAYLNGEWMAPEQARVSVFDRGFMFGDGVYEVMAVYGQRVFALDAHLQRLGRSLDAIRIASPHSDGEWRELIAQAVEQGKENPAQLYLQVTRGVAMPRDHTYPAATKPTVLLTLMAAPLLSRRSVVPYKIVTKEDFRWARGDIKVISLIANGLLRNDALADGYDDAILVRAGKVTETPAANVFIVRDGTVVTPPKSNYLLHGITRDHIVKLCRDAGIPVEEREIAEAELLAADEVWISSTGHEVWPVGQVNQITVGNGSAGVLWQAVDALFQASKVDG